MGKETNERVETEASAISQKDFENRIGNLKALLDSQKNEISVRSDSSHEAHSALHSEIFEAGKVARPLETGRINSTPDQAGILEAMRHVSEELARTSELLASNLESESERHRLSAVQKENSELAPYSSRFKNFPHPYAGTFSETLSDETSEIFSTNKTSVSEYTSYRPALSDRTYKINKADRSNKLISDFNRLSWEEHSEKLVQEESFSFKFESESESESAYRFESESAKALKNVKKFEFSEEEFWPKPFSFEDFQDIESDSQRLNMENLNSRVWGNDLSSESEDDFAFESDSELDFEGDSEFDEADFDSESGSQAHAEVKSRDIWIDGEHISGNISRADLLANELSDPDDEASSSERAVNSSNLKTKNSGKSPSHVSWEKLAPKESRHERKSAHKIHPLSIIIGIVIIIIFVIGIFLLAKGRGLIK